jgi:hypothetical protein
MQWKKFVGLPIAAAHQGGCCHDPLNLLFLSQQMLMMPDALILFLL